MSAWKLVFSLLADLTRNDGDNVLSWWFAMLDNILLMVKLEISDGDCGFDKKNLLNLHGTLNS